MILSCNSCEKKFVVPDKAITASGRLVQCGSCGNKWKQFPVKNEVNKLKIEKDERPKKVIKTSKQKKKKTGKVREINLYSPEYLAKKHGITLNNDNNVSSKKKTNVNSNVSFGFYNYIILLLVILIAVSKGLHLLQDFIVSELPFTEFYLNYFFETIRNVFEIWKNLISSY